MHRDLTAGNVIVERVSRDDIKILLGDLGLAKDVTTQNPQTICGTPGFMPPDFIDGPYGIESEVYSLGGILYYMLTRRSPKPGQEEQQLERITDPDAADLIKNLWHKNPARRLTLNEIKRHPFLNDSRVRYEEPSSNRSANRKRRTPSVCKHLQMQKGICSCGFKQTADSAYGSKETDTTGTTNRRRRTSSERRSGNTEKRIPSRERRNASAEKRIDKTERRHASTERRSNKTAHDKSVEDIIWPVPSFYYFKPNLRGQLDETRWVTEKGRYMIMDSDLFVYEATPRNSKYVEYIFEVKFKKNKQEVLVYKPTNKNQPLSKIGDDMIEERNFIKRITSADELDNEYVKYYNYIVNAVNTFYKRNAKLNYGYVGGNRNYTAKLMYDGTFRFIFNHHVFVQNPNTADGEFYPTGKSQTYQLTKEQRKLFIETREFLLQNDRFRTKQYGKYYPRLNMDEKL